jgi:hypothetical protein
VSSVVLQGNCSSPAAQDGVTSLNRGQCRVTADTTVLYFNGSTAADVWISQIAFRSRADQNVLDEGLIHWHPTTWLSRLWLSNVSIDGGDLGLWSQARVFAQGAHSHLLCMASDSVTVRFWIF